jgi:hypothetical protein
MRLQAVTVYPLAQALRRMPCCCQDGTAGDAFEAVDLPAAGELYASGASDRVDGQAVDGVAVAVDGETHRLFADVSILQGQAISGGR